MNQQTEKEEHDEDLTLENINRLLKIIRSDYDWQGGVIQEYIALLQSENDKLNARFQKCIRITKGYEPELADYIMQKINVTEK